MAEYVKGRFHAARVGATMAILGLLAGLGIKSEQRPPTTVVADPASALSIGKNTIGTAQIKQHSLLFTDIKSHQVPSYKEFKFFRTQFQTFKNAVYDKHAIDTTFAKLGDVNSTFVKIEDANAEFLKISDATDKFLTLTGTAADSNKIGGLTPSQLIQGHGSVITGSTAVGATDSDVFILIGLLKASVKNTPGGGSSVDVTLTNLSSTDTLLVNGDGSQQTASIAPGKTDTVTMADGSVRTLGVVIQGGTTAITIGLSSFTGGVHTLVGQAVVGSY